MTDNGLKAILLIYNFCVILIAASLVIGLYYLSGSFLSVFGLLALLGLMNAREHD